MNDDPPPKPELPVSGENAEAEAGLIARNNAAIRKVQEANDERRKKSPKINPSVY